ncbi:MAG: Mrp/NBP35 family ATP-binding protein [Beijerinckiaceae bacterium]
MVSEQDVLDALQSIVGPDGKTPLPQTGSIAGVTVKEGKVFLSIRIEAREAPTMETLRVAAEKAIRAIPGVTTALVSLTAEKPAAAKPASPAPAPGPARSNAIPGVERIIAVASGKGGVGKSTTAVNLALGLASLGWRIGILDLDIFGPSLPRLLGRNDKPEMEGNLLRPLTAYGLKAMSIGFLVEEETAMVWRGPMVMSAVQQLLRDVAWGELDCLVVDMPPGTGDAQLTLAQTVPLAGAVIVSTPQDLALIDARRGITMFQKVDVPVLGVVENMSYFLCPHCGGRSDIFSHGGARREAEKLGVPFLGEIPLTLDIREHSDAGRPIVATDPESLHAIAYRDVAARVQASLETSSRRAAPKIVIE